MADIDLATHFAFGENWADFSNTITDRSIEDARQGLIKLVGPDLSGKSFLDIGCGSGLHALAALNLGASSAMATDIDPVSVETTRKVLDRYAPAGTWRAETISVLSPEFGRLGQFDVVYSWGVLHHTGAMREAIAMAASATKPGGKFIIAIYRKTPFCAAWRMEKWLYTNSPKFIQAAIFWTYKLIMDSLIWVKYVAARTRKTLRRGMDRDHDYRDWLGGYPYESATPAEIDAIVLPLGFQKEKQEVPKLHFMGLFGTGCAEYLYQQL